MQQNKRSRGGGGVSGVTDAKPPPPAGGGTTKLVGGTVRPGHHDVKTASGETIDWQQRWKEDMTKVKIAWSTKYEALRLAHSDLKKHSQIELKKETESWKSVLGKHLPKDLTDQIRNQLTPATLDEYLTNHPLQPNLSEEEKSSELKSLEEELKGLKSQLAQREEQTCLLITEVQRLAAMTSKSAADSTKENQNSTNTSSNSRGGGGAGGDLTKQIDQLKTRLMNAKAESNARICLIQSAILSILGWEILSHKIISEEACDGSSAAQSSSSSSSPRSTPALDSQESQGDKSRIFQMQLRPLYKSPEDPGDIIVHLDVHELAQQIRNKETRKFVEHRLRATSSINGAAGVGGGGGSWDISNTTHKQFLRFNGRLQMRWQSARWRDVFSSRKQIPSLLSVILLDEHLALMKLQGRVASRDIKLREVIAEELLGNS